MHCSESKCTSLLNEMIGNSNLKSSDSTLASFCPELVSNTFFAKLMSFSSPIGKFCRRICSAKQDELAHSSDECGLKYLQNMIPMPFIAHLGGPRKGSRSYFCNGHAIVWLFGNRGACAGGITCCLMLFRAFHNVPQIAMGNATRRPHDTEAKSAVIRSPSLQSRLPETLVDISKTCR